MLDPAGVAVTAERGVLQLGQLVERTRDPHRALAEVDRHCVVLRPDDTAHAVGVVRNQVTTFERLDDRLGIGLEGAAGEMAPPRC